MGSILARVLVLLLPIAVVGLFGRVLYTPDEPREASLVVAMAHQTDKSLPELAGVPFAEKPPLLYWAGGAAVAALGPAPWVLRLPGVVWLLGAALAMGALAMRAAGPRAAFAAAIVTATALQLYQALIWLATDAPLVAGVALALLGAYRGLTEDTDARRRMGYLLFHAGLAIAFFAKGFAGWMVPVCALLTVLVLERRMRVLASAAFWWGATVPVGLLLIWVVRLWMRPDGHTELLVLFWYNLVGRAFAIQAPAPFVYSAGHGNSPGKYLLELPLYLLPWTPLALAALRKLPRVLRRADEEGTAWRLGLGAIAVPTVLLSLAATARGVYYAPVALGFALLIGLYVAGSGAASDRYDRLAWRVSGVLITVMALLLGGAAVLAGLSPREFSLESTLMAFVALVGALIAIGLALTPRQMSVACLPRQALALTLVLTLVVGPLYLRVNDWLSLETVATQIHEASHGMSLTLIDPDETTVAMASLYLPEAHGARAGETPSLTGDLDGDALWLMPGGHWRGNQWLSFLGYLPTEAVRVPPIPPLPAGFEAWRVRCVIERAGGRAFALLERGARGDASPGFCAMAPSALSE